jgi:hypothetical protein
MIMKELYKEPETRIHVLWTDKSFCLSDVPGIGGTTVPYEEDNENLNG